ncbi:MAG: S8 family serine peptidase [Fimbriimonadaceae bacterium]|nr:S8 family serine peptidase [Fimbriimonadaceae bacterium]
MKFHLFCLPTVVIAGVLAGSASFASGPQGPGHYYERPGIQEFSGEMIVRPLQTPDLKARGLGSVEMSLVQLRARQRVLPYSVEYVEITDEFIIRVPQGETENSMSLKLMRTGDYQYAEPNWICYPLRIPNDAMYGQQWHHPVIKAPQAWDTVIGLASQTVAVVDTGIDITHPDLAPNRVPGYNSVDRKREVDGGEVNDINGHGTHVAGDAAAVGNNSIGVTGPGWNFKIMMIRTSNSPGGGASTADIMDGARWAAANGARTVSASYSGVDAAAVGTTGTAIKAMGSLFLYAAGNDNRDLSGFSHRDTIVVGATDVGDVKAGFSAYGRGVHLFAPGVNILSTTNGGGYGGSSGTSMSTPVANGGLALIWAANPSLTAQQAQDALENSCDNIGSSAIFGKGRINLLKGVQQARAMQGTDVFPSSVQTTEGVWLSGTLADLSGNNLGRGYTIASSSTALGQVAAATFTYNTGTTPSRALSLKFAFVANQNPQTIVTGMIYAYNWSTSRWDMIGQFPMSSTSNAEQSKTLTTNLSRYISSSGVVQTKYRAVSTTRGSGLPPMSYQLKIRRAKLSVAAMP